MRHGIPEFQARRPLVEQLGAGVLNRILKELESLRIISVVGGSVRKLPGGTEIVLGAPRGNGGTPYHPFEVRLRRSSSTTFAGVVYQSRLFNTLQPDDIQTITGLLTSDAPTPSDDGWFAINDGDFVWLEVTFNTSTGNPTAASIQHGADDFDPTALAWNEGSFLEDDGETLPAQTKARKLLAYYADGVLTQCVDRDQVLLDCIVNGRSARYPFDHSGWYLPPA